MSAILTTAAPLFAIILSGFLAGRRGLMTEAHAGALSRFVFLFAMPAAVFRYAALGTPPDAQAAVFALAYLGAAGLSMTIAYQIGRRLLRLKPREAGAHAFGSTLGNAVFLGIPIAQSVPGWGVPFLLLVLMEGVFIIAAGTALMTQPEEGPAMGLGRQAVDTVKRVSRNPIAMGTVLGFLCAAAGLVIPAPIERFLFYLGGAAGPAALFALGVTLSIRREAPETGGVQSIVSITLMKLVAQPALVVGAMLLIGASPAQIGAAALFTTVPMGVGVYVQAAHYGVYQRRIAAALTATTIASVFTVSGVLFFLAPSG
ncbi:MAG: AEC family transporter [Pseudomonadota bacterium]